MTFTFATGAFIGFFVGIAFAVIVLVGRSVRRDDVEHKLTKPILEAIEEYGPKPSLRWEFLRGGARTAPYGYALLLLTGSRENGTVRERRLWCGDIKKACWIAAELERRGIPNMCQWLVDLQMDVLASEAAWAHRIGW